MENPLALLVVTVSAIVFAFKYFNQPAYFEKGRVSDYFSKRFTLTDRECEIATALANGMGNAQIAEKLFISVRTVESHLYNIFQKTGVKNRVQLANLLQTNSR